MKVFLIRHGLTRLGEEGRYQGALDEGLSPAGRAALRRADFTPARVFVSPARRARETAALLFPESEQVAVDALREMDFGDFDGRGWWEMEEDAAYRAWVDGGCTGRCPGGEDRAAFTERVCTAVEALLREAADELVIVAHGGTQMALLSHRGEPACGYFAWQRPCGCGWELDYKKETGKLRAVREVGFLK